MPEPEEENVPIRGRRPETRLQIVFSAGLMSVVVVGIVLSIIRPWGESTSNPTKPAAGSKGPTTAPTDEGTAVDLGSVTACAAVPWLPRDTEFDTSLDPQDQQLRVDYTDTAGKNHTYVIAYGTDSACRGRPDIRRVLEHALATAAESS